MIFGTCGIAFLLLLLHIEYTTSAEVTRENQKYEHLLASCVACRF